MNITFAHFRQSTITLSAPIVQSAVTFASPADALNSARNNVRLAAIWRTRSPKMAAELLAYATADRCAYVALKNPPVVENTTPEVIEPTLSESVAEIIVNNADAA